MVLSAHDDLGRPRFTWPEPLIAETIHAIYDPGAQRDDTMTAARLHARFLHALVDGETEQAGPLRVELIACCAARRIAPEIIATADLAAFRELKALARSRFRNSTRLQMQFLERLQEAMGALTARSAPRKPTWRDRLAKPAQRPALALSD